MLPDWLSRNEQLIGVNWSVSWRVLLRDKHDSGIKEISCTGKGFGRSKLKARCGGGGQGVSYMKGAGMLVGNFELNP